MQILDAVTDFGSNADGLFRVTSQEIDKTLLDRLKAQRDASMTSRMGDYHHAASVPVAVVEQWMREGFDILRDKSITPAQIIARLRKEGLDGFVATRRAV